jgi:signal transduction histidine kinase
VKQIADCVKGLSAPPDFVPCRIAAVTDSVFETLRWLAAERQVSLRRESLDELPSIMADERRLFSALYNLVNNAIPETPSGGSIVVAGRHDRDSDRIALTIRDTGRGMPPDVLKDLFTPRNKSRKAGGTGLGIKIVKDAVETHGGTIAVESELGVGTTFSLVLPLRPAHA